MSCAHVYYSILMYRYGIRVLSEFLDNSIASPFRRVVHTLKNCGATVLPVSLSNTRYALSAYYVIACAEARIKFTRYDGVRYGLHVPLPPDSVTPCCPGAVYAQPRAAGFGAEVKRRILLGTYSPTAECARSSYGPY